jgi:hypothetical protein
MADLGGFDATKVAPQGDMSPIPAGEYKAQIKKSEKKATKAGTGHYLELVLEIVDGQHKGRQVWDRLNIWNPNPTASQIAASTLSAICHATKVMQPKASEQLHGIPMIVKVAMIQRKDKNGDEVKGEYSNEVKAYKKLGSVAVAQAIEAPGGDSDDANKAPWEQ